ncbi:uncharacterized protein C4orf54 homolog [Mustelus asterias]
MLCLHFSVAGTGSAAAAAVNGTLSAHGTAKPAPTKGDRARAAPGGQLPASPRTLTGTQAAGKRLHRAPLPGGTGGDPAGRAGGDPAGRAGGDPARRAGGDPARRGQSAEGAEELAGGMRREETPADSRLRGAGGEETRAGGSGSLRWTGESPAEFSGYETAAGSDIYESFSDGDGGGVGSAGEAAPLRRSAGAQAGRKDGGAGLSGKPDLSREDFPPGGNDETHFISTHEIQLYELDHDGDCEFALGSSCALEESSAVYAFLDSSSLESDASEETSDTPRGSSPTEEAPPLWGAAEAASDGQEIRGNGECAEGTERPGTANSSGHIHLSIQASSRAVGEQEKEQENCARKEAAERDWRGNSRCLPGGGRADGAVPTAKSPLRGKGLEYYSGSSSAISELDDTDKEVRNLTARTFRSLACRGDEYLDTYYSANRSTDVSFLSAETIGMNHWAEYIDSRCRNAAENGNPRQCAGENSALNGQRREETPSGKRQGAGRERKHLPGVKEAASAVTEKPEKRAVAAGTETRSHRQIQVSGKLEEVGSRVITLTETVNLSYDVKEGTAARRESQRIAGPAVRNPGGSRCADGVTEAVPREQGDGERCRETWRTAGDMENTQKKSKLASNLLQNVIGKKMQFEQELRMERGEISDTSFPGPAGPASPPLASETPKAATPVLSPGDPHKAPSGGSGSPESPPGTRSGDAAGVARLGSVPTCGRDLPAPAAAEEEEEEERAGGFQSQHSAFRSWKERPPTQTGRGPEPPGGRLELRKERKMSHLFIPRIQRAAEGRGEGGSPGQGVVLGQKGAGGGPGGGTGSCKSPEIRIKLRNRRESQQQSAFSIAKLLTPNIGGNAARPPADTKFHTVSTWFAEGAGQPGAEGRNKAPHFTVRDIRENIHKLQAPIHQVRDVRKLVKSSYHILTLEGSSGGGTKLQLPPGALTSLLPIVIKCQAVRNAPAAGKPLPEEGNPPSPRGDTPPTPGGDTPTPPAPMKNAQRPPAGRRAAGSPPAAAGAEKVASKQLALEKLTAAVKTMEELYVFDKNEWKRKSGSGADSLAGSHVLSLIASEEGEGAARPSARHPARRGEAAAKPPGAPPSLQPGNKVPQLFTVAPVLPQLRDLKPARARSPPAPPPPEFRSLRAPRRASLEEPRSVAAGTPPDNRSASQNPPPAEFENYLTIPIKAAAAPPPPAAYSRPPGPLHPHSPKQQREPSPATIYHQPPAQRVSFTPPGVQPPEPISPLKVHPPPVLMESSPVPCFPAPQTQRKMLLDPSTGQYYLVDTPLPPTRKRLYDPETRQYVDVPMPQQPMATMPVPMSPIAINPGTYSTTYMVYPGFLPTPAMLPTLPTPLSQPDNECNETAKPNSTASQPSEIHYMESPYYFPTGKASNPTHILTSQQVTRASKGFSEGKPVISFTSQPGPRIIAPPSFDGTTMSFVVEHR